MDQLSPEIRALYEKRLWHELTEKLMTLDGTTISNIWPQICQFSERLNQVKLVLLAIKASDWQDPSTARVFLESVQATDIQSGLLLRIAIGSQSLKQGNISEAAQMLETAQKEAEVLSDLDSVLYSHLYGALAAIHKVKNNPELFYRYSLQYLAYTASEDVKDKENLAFQLAVAVLVSEKIYNLGELMQQPLFKSLEGSKHHWIYELLHLCDQGNVREIEARFEGFPQELKTPELIRKVRILAMMEYIFKNDKWQLEFGELANVMDVPESSIEWLLMKAMALELIKGEIDEVNKTVRITWLQPRVLDTSRIHLIQNRLGEWKTTVNEVLKHLEDQSKELLE
ncbi:unnamed protein product [Blepharisma stoltei]|uniref:PCI domain-containing protein n=1 Tax=Blepharisma stoltei TaxID=1481888 RepID=A0AAU9IUY5_9CILI|nr:unnamed protein product [Blepharisma stoltei]